MHEDDDEVVTAICFLAPQRLSTTINYIKSVNTDGDGINETVNNCTEMPQAPPYLASSHQSLKSKSQVSYWRLSKLNKNLLVLASDWLSFSIPGSDMAIFLNRLLTLWPAFADVSMNMIFICVDLAVASSSVTCLKARELLSRRTNILI